MEMMCHYLNPIHFCNQFLFCHRDYIPTILGDAVFLNPQLRRYRDSILFGKRSLSCGVIKMTSRDPMTDGVCKPETNPFAFHE